jgi:Coenzyme PQQ synthesis protein D (PqqD)
VIISYHYDARMGKDIVQLDPAAVEWRQADGEVLVLDLRNSRYLAINRTGALLWPLLHQGATPAALQAAVSGAYDLPPADAERDVDRFLGWLGERGLLLDTG